MSEVESNVIVAIPAQNDPVWEISSEKIPHITLLYLAPLGDAEEQAVQFIQHASDTSLSRFGLSVDRRGTLGADDADVVFFNDNYALPPIAAFRQGLLTNPYIKQAYNAVEQFPSWTPHLTLGYPISPAKSLADNPGAPYYIQFDRIALWTKDFDGPTFELNNARGLEVQMSIIEDETVLSHHGIKGQKWGVRRDGTTSSSSTKTSRRARPATDISVKQKPGQFVKTKGGAKQIADGDAVRVASSRQLAKRSTTDALSTKQLQEAVNRMNLEQQYATLSKKSDRRTRGARFVQHFLGIKHPSEVQKGDKGKTNGQTPASKVGNAAVKAAVKAAKTAAK